MPFFPYVQNVFYVQFFWNRMLAIVFGLSWFCCCRYRRRRRCRSRLYCCHCHCYWCKYFEHYTILLCMISGIINNWRPNYIVARNAYDMLMQNRIREWKLDPVDLWWYCFACVWLTTQPAGRLTIWNADNVRYGRLFWFSFEFVGRSLLLYRYIVIVGVFWSLALPSADTP